MIVASSPAQALRRPRFFCNGCLAVAALLAAALLSGCAGRVPSPDARRASAVLIADEAGLAPMRIRAKGLTLQAFRRGEAPVLTVYIEGDGYAWRTPRRPSTDPTPITPVALRLAALERAPAVAYLGRPCQYGLADASCRTASLWTSARFSEQAVAATSQAIDQLKRAAGAQKVRLVGFSGGAAIAALTAARRGDVLSLTTIAGYLDPARLNAERGYSPLRDSLDPVRDAAPRLSALPQRHYSGGRDAVIPPSQAHAFIAAQNAPRCAEAVLIADASHRDGWERLWRAQPSSTPSCGLRPGLDTLH